MKVVERHKLQVTKYIGSGDVTYRLMTIVNNTLVYLDVAKGAHLNVLITRKKFVATYGHAC